MQKEYGGPTLRSTDVFRQYQADPYVYWHRDSNVKAYDYGFTYGVDTPHFHRLVREGALLPFTSFKQYELKGTGGGSSSIQSADWPASGFKEWCSDFFVRSEWWAPSMGDLEAIANQQDTGSMVQAVAAKIYSQGFDALSFLGELGETVRMIHDLKQKLLKIISKKSPGKLEDLWLEGRYGWRTLQYDIRNLNEALQSHNDTLHRHKDRVGTTETWTDSTSWTESTSYQSTYRTLTTRYVVGVRGSMVADIRIPKFQFNPVVTAWELTRLSFVVDWFLNVGRSLNALSFLALNPEYTAAGSVKVEAHRVLTSVGSALGGYHYTLPWSEYCDSTSVYIVRSPQRVSITPRFDVNLSAAKLIDLTALSKQRHLI